MAVSDRGDDRDGGAWWFTSVSVSVMHATFERAGWFLVGMVSRSVIAAFHAGSLTSQMGKSLMLRFHILLGHKSGQDTENQADNSQAWAARTLGPLKRPQNRIAQSTTARPGQIAAQQSPRTRTEPTLLDLGLYGSTQMDSAPSLRSVVRPVESKRSCTWASGGSFVLRTTW